MFIVDGKFSPKGIYDFGMKLKKNVQIYLSLFLKMEWGVEGEEKYMDENGTVQDDYRIEFVRESFRMDR